MLIDIKFSSILAEDIFFSPHRFITIRGGYGSGKTFLACQKLIFDFLLIYPNYHVLIARQTAKDLRRTTKKTFFEVAPKELITRDADGIGETDFINGSRVYWAHLDEFDEGTLRSLEVNAAFIDQGEEVAENIFTTLISRLGRWRGAKVPQWLLDKYPKWPRNQFDNEPIPPSYFITVTNPSPIGEYHWSERFFNPESPDYRPGYMHYVMDSRNNLALSREVLKNMLQNDVEWQEKYIKGNFAFSESAIHNIHPDSILEVDFAWVSKLISQSQLARSLDHGASAPTACLWFASDTENRHYCWQEYYQGGLVVSEHRENIHKLSRSLNYAVNVADPAIFKKSQEKYGGFWSVALEYADVSIPNTPIVWAPGDNNELATRNRINEYLKPTEGIKHPLTGKTPAPRLYFIKRTEEYPFGCFEVIRQTRAQRKNLIGEVNGRQIFGDDRNRNIVDHAYDALRYFVATHLVNNTRIEEIPSVYSINGFKRFSKMLKMLNNGRLPERMYFPARMQ